MSSKRMNKTRNTRKRKALTQPQKAQINRLLNAQIETKHSYTNLLHLPTFNGSLSNITNVINQGDGVYNERVGDVVKLHFLRIKLLITAQTATPQHVRVIIFQYRLPSAGATAPSIGEIVEAAYLGTSYVPFAPLSYNDKQQFKILYDKRLAVSSTDRTFVVMNKSISNFNKTMKFDVGTANVSKNGLFLLTFSNVNVSPPYVEFFSELYYKDG